VNRDPSGEPVPDLPVLERRRRNMAIVMVLLGLVSMAGAALGFALMRAHQAGRSDYGGAGELKSAFPAAEPAASEDAQLPDAPAGARRTEPQPTPPSEAQPAPGDDN